MDHNLILDLERCWMDSRNNKHGLIKFYGKIIKKMIHITYQLTFDWKLRILLLFLSLLKKHKSTQIFSSLYITPHYHNLSFLFSSLFLYLSSLLQQLPQFPLCLHLNKPLKPIIRTILIYFDFQVLLNRLYINPLLRILKLPTNSNILISKATPIEIRNPKYIIFQVGKDQVWLAALIHNLNFYKMPAL